MGQSTQVPAEIWKQPCTGAHELCDRLALHLGGTSPGSPRRRHRRYRALEHRYRATAVLASLASPSHASVLARVLLNGWEELYTRITAGGGLIRLGESLPVEVRQHLEANLPALLRDKELWYRDHNWPEQFERFLLLFSPETLHSVLPPVLGKWSSRSRAELLAALAAAEAPWESVAWLYERWLQEDRLSGGLHTDHWAGNRRVSLNVWIAHLTRHRLESRALLEEYRKRPHEELQYTVRYGGREWLTGTWESLPPELWANEEELLQAIDAEPLAFQDQARELDLPWSALVRFADPDTLLTDVEREIRAVSRSHAAKQGAEPFHETTKLRRSLEILTRAEDPCIDERLTSLYLCPELHWYLKDSVFDILWERSWRSAAEQAMVTVRGWAEQPGCIITKGRALLRLAASPHPDNRPFYWWAVRRDEKPEFRYQALLALERIGEDTPEWGERLIELAEDPDPVTRVAAAEALLRRGEESRLATLVETAAESPDLHARTEALRIVGEQARAEHTGLFLRAALRPSDLEDYSADNDAIEAAYQLASLGTSEAVSALIQICFLGGDGVARVVREQYLPAAFGDREALNHPQCLRHRDWRLSRPWEWRCCGGE